MGGRQPRSRKHITTYYDTSAIGEFPKRNKPLSIECPLSATNSINYQTIAENLTLLNLSVYSPLGYILPGKVQFYADLYDKKVNSGTLTQVDRERSLQMLMRINLLKRIESSVDSFRLTLENIINQIYDAVKAIMKNEEEVYSGIQANDITNDVDWESD